MFKASCLLLLSIAWVLFPPAASEANMVFDSSFEAGNGTWFSESPPGTAQVTTEADPYPANPAYGDYFYFSLDNVLGDALTVRVDFKNDRRVKFRRDSRRP